VGEVVYWVLLVVSGVLIFGAVITLFYQFKNIGRHICKPYLDNFVGFKGLKWTDGWHTVTKAETVQSLLTGIGIGDIDTGYLLDANQEKVFRILKECLNFATKAKIDESSPNFGIGDIFNVESKLSDMSSIRSVTIFSKPDKTRKIIIPLSEFLKLDFKKFVEYLTEIGVRDLKNILISFSTGND